MFLIILGLVLAALLSWVYLRWQNLKQYWAKRGVAHLPPHPIMGSLTFLQKKNPSVWMVEMYKKFKAPYIGIWLFWRPALIINSPDLARNILVKDFSCFRDRFLSSGPSDPIGSLNMLTVKDPLWSTIRRRLTSAFTASKLRSLQPLVNTKARELVQRIKNTEDKTKLSLRPYPPQHLFSDYTTDVSATAAFGVETNATLTGKDPMRTVTGAFMKFDVFRGLSWISVFFIPSLVDTFRFTVFPKWATDYFTKIYTIVSEQRLEQKRTEEPRDFLDVLLKLKEDSAKNNEGVSDDAILAQAVIFLFAGFETTAAALSFVTYELAYHPEVQERLYKELRELMDKSPNEQYDMSELAELPYLNAVMKETLRKFAPMAWLDRVALEEYKIDDHLTIPAGTPVYVNSIGMQYDSKYFPDPKQFDPDRFMPENEANLTPFTCMPFGEGPRGCLGKRFGQMSLRYGLSYLVLNYKIVPLPGAPKPDEVEIEKRGLSLVPGEKIFVDFVSRM
ncbi:unnamed protein product [Leptosia nina]|uniref:unspecific monooxygenase n=1 Tax=Leptosia nina TaxID=320188 RepID=A0AAV1JE12_9NEOP